MGPPTTVSPTDHVSLGSKAKSDSSNAASAVALAGTHSSILKDAAVASPVPEAKIASHLSSSPAQDIALPRSQLWATSVDNPQLDERDSIFATTYAPDSPPSGSIANSIAERQRRFHGVPSSSSQLPVAGAAGREVTIPNTPDQLIPESDSVGSLTPTPSNQYPLRPSAQRRARPNSRLPIDTRVTFQSPAREPFVPMGTPKDGSNGTHGPLGSPIQFSTSPSDIDPVQSPPLEPEEEAERIRYRSWRQGKADRAGKLPRTVKRSRSGDGWFGRKIEATLPNLDAQKISSRSRKSSQYLGVFKEQVTASQFAKEDTSKASGKTGQTSSSMLTRALHENKADSPRVYNALALGGPEPREPKKLISSKSQPDMQSLSGSTIASRSSISTNKDVQQSISPLDLAHERLRNREYTASSAEASSHRRRGSSPESDEESDREHISAASFLPHRKLRLDDSPSMKPAAKPPLLRSKSDFDRKNMEAIEEQILEQEDGAPNDVEISLTSKGEKEVWKSNLAEPEESIGSEQSSPTDETGDEYEISSSASEFDSHDESAASTSGCESEFAPDNVGVSPSTPKAPGASRVRKHRPRVPRGKVELKPFSHQVGGHSTVYQFSRRAICKQLNNRENVFYETVEKYHPDLVEFMPK
jgi:inositol-hexakisphosphate 5-kinase